MSHIIIISTHETGSKDKLLVMSHIICRMACIGYHSQCGLPAGSEHLLGGGALMDWPRVCKNTVVPPQSDLYSSNAETHAMVNELRP